MSKFDLTITLFTIVYGLMLSELYVSVHRLIRARKRVHWHALPLLAAWYILMLIINNWWNLAFDPHATDSISIYLFIAYGHLLLIIYLLASAVLPDAIPETGMDLREYYFDNQRYFWGLVCCEMLILILIDIGKLVFLGKHLMLAAVIGRCLFMVISVILMFNRKTWVHVSGLVFFLLVLFLEIGGK